MGNNLYGAGEAPSTNLGGITNLAQTSDTYPITFGKGLWVDDTTLTTIAAKGDGDKKIRFVYGVGSTTSGAIYVGNKLSSSKILDITKAVDGVITTVTVTFIGADNTVQTMDFDVTDPEALEKVQAYLQAETISSDSTNGGLTVTATPDAETGFNTYEINVNVDGETIDIVNNELTGAKYELTRIPDGEADEQYASQYHLVMTSPDGQTTVIAGDTINIDKDRMVRSAEVLVFDKNSDGEAYDPVADAGEPFYALDKNGDLLQAPDGYGIQLNHTYLRLVINTIGNDEGGSAGTNDNTNDVYLDFTEIMGAAAFEAMDASIKDHENRLLEIEGSYVKTVEISTPGQDDQFETVSVTVSNDGTDTDVEFDIPTQNYYDSVSENFTQLEANDQVFADALTWQGLD